MFLPPQPIPACVIALAIVTASTDLTCRRIPNRIIAIGLAAALIVQIRLNGPLAGSADWLMGALTGFAVLLPFYLLRGMAAGDVKLLLTIGAWVGPAMTVRIALATFIAGGIWSLCVTLRRRRARQLLVNLWCIVSSMWTPGRQIAGIPQYQQIESVGSLPYGVAIAAGTLGVLFASAA
ncbi:MULTISPECIES: A24 family peptidase [Paraburkholderia]|jgi:prepilin peptidase CpaA|uniref:Peptidase A24 n=1 Tax=Paraburkholderia madseniana TaxID=2599607 RepID=A0A6N6WGW9_9BURK|nr:MULTISPECIES: prepilin peptidase [Paraburkholderia]KAE8758660.1 peptidase A24 [Paraburkholderia madseniana]MCX4170666.1 prepilin peptidase [Paraburkholderia madseniana]MDQ6458678.1 prepilin peptidase [Paraburkholderia madseniana]NPT65012.1 peptidase A24 [Paraburkholderia madseniana]